MQPQHPPELGDHLGVGVAGRGRDAGWGPADPRVLGDLDPQLLRERLEPRVVPAPLTRGVLDPADVGQGVRGLVQQRSGSVRDSQLWTWQ